MTVRYQDLSFFNNDDGTEMKFLDAADVRTRKMVD